MTTKRGEAAAIVPSEMKGRKAPMTAEEHDTGGAPDRSGTAAAVGRRRAVSDQARRPAEWQPPDDGRLYTLVACSGCGTGYPVRYLAHLEDGRYLCRSCFDTWMEEEQ